MIQAKARAAACLALDDTLSAAAAVSLLSNDKGLKQRIKELQKRIEG